MHSIVSYHFKNAKGITIIALTVTIIILLILAGITISTSVGENRNYRKNTKFY